MLTPLVAGEPSTVDILEGETPTYTATVKDDTGTALPAASLSTLTLTLYVIKTDGSIAYVNSRNAQNILNANQVTVTAQGLVTWKLVVADTTLVEDLAFERHVALFEWGWTSSAIARAGKHELVLTVKALHEVP